MSYPTRWVCYQCEQILHYPLCAFPEVGRVSCGVKLGVVIVWHIRNIPLEVFILQTEKPFLGLWVSGVPLQMLSMHLRLFI